MLLSEKVSLFFRVPTCPLLKPSKPSLTANILCPSEMPTLTAERTAAFMPAAGAPTFSTATLKLLCGHKLYMKTNNQVRQESMTSNYALIFYLSLSTCTIHAALSVRHVTAWIKARSFMTHTDRKPCLWMVRGKPRVCHFIWCTLYQAIHWV